MVPAALDAALPEEVAGMPLTSPLVHARPAFRPPVLLAYVLTYYQPHTHNTRNMGGRPPAQHQLVALLLLLPSNRQPPLPTPYPAQRPRYAICRTVSRASMATTYLPGLKLDLVDRPAQTS